MKQIVKFSRMFIPFMLFSLCLVATGIIGYQIKGGFNMGIDFRAGLIQEVQLAPRAFGLSYDGPGNAEVILSNTSLTITVSGVGVQGFSYQYLFSDYGTVEAFAQALDQIEGITAVSVVSGSAVFKQLVEDAQSGSLLPPFSEEQDDLYWVHYLPLLASPVPLEEARQALDSFGSPAVQILGEPEERRFLIRLQDSDMEEGSSSSEVSKAIGKALEDHFGKGEVAITSFNYVGSRFSKALADQAVWLLGATLVLILLYASVRFKVRYAIGAVLGIIHNGLIQVGFIAWSGMEFNTTTIAAIMTILGYSINDTIVVFDRIRETAKLYPDEKFEQVLNRAITETLGRTFITTLTTMLAVGSLYIFTTGSMKDFALALMVGLITGVYSTIFIGCGFVYFLNRNVKQSDTETPKPKD